MKHILSGIVAPTSTPTGVGHHYVNTATGETYISVGTSSSADWKLLSGGSTVRADTLLLKNATDGLYYEMKCITFQGDIILQPQQTNTP